MTQATRRFYMSSDETLQATTTKPLSYVDWLKYEPTFDRSAAFEQYTNYLTQWYSNKGINDVSVQQQYVRNIYIELLKQISLEYSTVEEQRFLQNIQYDNDNDLDVALPFFAKKVKQIAIYYAEQRDELKTSSTRANLKGSSFGMNQLLYKQIADTISNDPDILTQLSNLSLTVSDVLKNLQIDTVELYDTSQVYYNIPSGANKDKHTTTSDKQRQQYFETNLLPDVAKTFLAEQFNNAVIDTIKAVPVTLQTGILQADSAGDEELLSNGMSLAITDIVTGTELDRLDDSAFQNYTKTGDLNILSEQLAFKTYAGTDYYYLSSGSTVTDTTSGKLFSANNAHKELLNKFHPTIATTPGNSTFSQEFLGGFFDMNGVGLLTYTSLDYQYEFNIEPDTFYSFPDPAAGAAGYYGGIEKLSTPIVYYENHQWQHHNISTHYNYGTQQQYKNMSRFTPYQSKSDTTFSEFGVYRHNDTFDFWASNGRNVWENSDVYPLNEQREQQTSQRADTLNTRYKIVYKQKTDIYGNSYTLTKYDTRLVDDPPINNNTTIYDTEYIDPETKTYNFPGKKMNRLDEWSTPGELSIRTINDTGAQSLTSNTLSSIYLKYVTNGTLKYPQGEISLSDVHDEITSTVIDMDVIHDIIIIHTTNYIIFEKLVYDYDTGIVSSDQKNYSIIKRSWTTGDYEKCTNTWYDENQNRIILCKTALHPTLSASTSRMIYPEIHVYDMNKTYLKQVYPDPDYTMDQLTYETGQYSLSSINTVDSTEIVEIKTPRLSYNKDSESYNIFYLGKDINENICMPRIDFKMYDNIIDSIDVSIFRNRYNTHVMNPADDVDHSPAFRENNPTITSPTWFHDTNRNLMFMSSTNNNNDPAPVSNSACVWTYGSLPQNYASERDIVIGFDFLMSGTLNDPSTRPDGIGITFFRARVIDQIQPYPGALAPAYESLDDGGLGPAFSYLDDKTRGTLNYEELDGLDSGHAHVILNTGGQVGTQITSENSVTVMGPLLSTNINSNTNSLNDTNFNLYTSLTTGTDYIDHQFTRCRVTLTNFARTVHVDLKPSGSTDNFTRVSTTDVSEFFPMGYTTPDRLKVALSSNTSTTNTGIIAIKNITTTGSANITRV